MAFSVMSGFVVLALVLLWSTLLTLSQSLRSNPVPVEKIFIDEETGRFVDQKGRVRLFRGINSVRKGPPWYEESLLDPEVVATDLSLKLGMNVVRLGSMWTGWQPDNSSQFNRTYINVLKDIVARLEDAGIHTILDAHQDGLWQSGQGPDGYWGVPPWVKAKVAGNLSQHQYPWPLKAVDRWECQYLTEEVGQGFEALYSNRAGVADDFAQFWKRVAIEFEGPLRDAILGYELINEPFGGNVYDHNHEMVYPGLAGRKHLAPFYEKVQAAIRSADPDATIFWEPVTWSYLVPLFSWMRHQPRTLWDFWLKRFFGFGVRQFCGATSPVPQETQGEPWNGPGASFQEMPDRFPLWDTGFDQPPGGSQYANRSVMSWHYYCMFSMTEGSSSDEPYQWWKRRLCDSVFGPNVFSTAIQSARKAQSGSFLTEFGLCRPNASNPDSENFIECNHVMDAADDSFQSWTYWDSNYLWDDRVGLVPEVAISFARPFPMATAGTPLKLNFDVRKRIFKYSFKTQVRPLGDCKESPTVISLPDLHYPNGSFKVKVSQGLEWRAETLAKRKVLVVFDPECASRTLVASVTISPLHL